jgi:hypothetical protein
MFFQDRVISTGVLVKKIAELIPEYLPGMDTGAAEPTDRRICWNKTLESLLTVVGKEHGVAVQVDTPAHEDEQLSLYWKRGDAILLAAFTGWGDRNSLERRLQRLESIKAGQKILLYTCNRWQQAVLEQIHAALLRYTDHLAGEQYLFINLLGSETRMLAHRVDIPKNGALEYRPDLLQLVDGSPFVWRAGKSGA